MESGSLPQTTLGFTGQRRDGTGLLYYHARMYDPVLARFVSADSVVPSNASGNLGGIALKPLTVDFHEVGFGATLNGENGQPFWFQLSDQQRQHAGDPWGPANPQALNRYSYVLNSPLRWTDPSGHLKTLENSVYGYSYSTVTAPDPKHFVPYRDAQGNMVYADPTTGVLYIQDASGIRHRIFKICHNNTCKYTYEHDAGFESYREAVDALDKALGDIAQITGSAALAGCIIGAIGSSWSGPGAIIGCGVGGAALAAGALGSAMMNLIAVATWAIPQMQDSFNEPSLPNSGAPPWEKKKR